MTEIREDVFSLQTGHAVFNLTLIGPIQRVELVDMLEWMDLLKRKIQKRIDKMDAAIAEPVSLAALFPE